MRDPAASLFTTPAMSAVFAAETQVRYMLDFEAALARAEARAGVIPLPAAAAITAACQNGVFDVTALYQAAATAGTPVIPLVQMLTQQVDADGRDFVHWGATSQDTLDTALMLQMRVGLDLLIADLGEIRQTCATLADKHRHTLMPGRTLLQQALPITFGLKAARWLGLVTRQITALTDHRQRSLALQFGGAAGALAALGAQGGVVASYLAEELHLPLPDLPWHTERDRVAAIAMSVAITAGAMTKIAGDIVLLAQTEVGEVTEATAPGKGGSSAMPQKRNPIDTTLALAAARLAMGQAPVILAALAQEHERAVGGWQAEWAAIPDLFCYTAGAVDRVKRAVHGLQIYPDRMRANLNLNGGLLMAEALTMALAAHLGRPTALRLVQTLCDQATTTGQTLAQVALASEPVRAVLSPDAIQQALDPAGYLGSADEMIDQVLRETILYFIPTSSC